jgi:hypothetical protein
MNTLSNFVSGLIEGSLDLNKVLEILDEEGQPADINSIMSSMGFSPSKTSLAGGSKGDRKHFAGHGLLVDVRHYPEHKGKSGRRVGAVYDWWVKTKGGKRYHGTHISALRSFLKSHKS